MLKRGGSVLIFLSGLVNFCLLLLLMVIVAFFLLFFGEHVPEFLLDRLLWCEVAVFGHLFPCLKVMTHMVHEVVLVSKLKVITL